MNDVMNELKQIRVEIEVIKNNLVDPDNILIGEEGRRLNDALGEYERGETTSLEDFEKEIKDV